MDHLGPSAHRARSESQIKFNKSFVLLIRFAADTTAALALMSGLMVAVPSAQGARFNLLANIAVSHTMAD